MHPVHRHTYIIKLTVFKDTFSFSLYIEYCKPLFYTRWAHIISKFLSPWDEKTGVNDWSFPDWSSQPPAPLTPIINSSLVLVIPLQDGHFLLLTPFFMFRIYLFPSSLHSVLVYMKHVEYFWVTEYNYNTGNATNLNSSHFRNTSVFSHHRSHLPCPFVILIGSLSDLTLHS